MILKRNKRPLVVVLTRNYSTGLSVIRALGKAGYTVDVIASAVKEGKSRLVSVSRYVNRYTEVVSAKISGDNDEALIEALLKYETEESSAAGIILFPTDDYTTSVMDLNRDRLEKIFIMPGVAGGSKGTLKHLMDKSVQGQIARATGIDTPAEWVISLRGELVIPEDMIYPCWCKPLESSLGYKTEMKKCDNQDELILHLLKLKERFSERSVLVQKYLSIDEEIDLEGVCLNDRIILPGIIRKRIVAVHDKGVPLAGEMIPIEKLGPMQEKVVEMLKAFHYYGMFDLGLNIVGDKIYFNEVNLRSGGTNHVYFASGVNLPDLFIKGIRGEKIHEKETRIKTLGKSYVYEKVAWEDYLHDIMSKEELDACIENADITIMRNDEDPLPEKIFLEEVTERDRIRRNRKRREEHIANIAKASGWQREFVEEKVREAREKLGVSIADYDRYGFWQYQEDEQAEKYKEITERRARIKKQREDCIKSAMELTGWDEERAVKEIDGARKRLGVTYNEYRKNKFCLMNAAEQDKAHAEIMRKKDKQ